MKKKIFIPVFILTILLAICMSAGVFAADSTKYKTVSTYDKNKGTLTFDVYLSGGKAIVGYCSFDYDSSVLTLLDGTSSPVPDEVPDRAIGTSYDYIKSIVKANGDFVITHNGKGTSKLINTRDGYVFFAWYIPVSVAEYVDASKKDILLATIEFSVKENKVPTDECITVAPESLTKNVDGWYPGLIVVLDGGKQQNRYDGENEGREFYSTEFITVDIVEIEEEEETEENVESDTEEEKEDIVEFPDGFLNPDLDDERHEPSDSNDDEAIEDVRFADVADFSLEITAESEEARFKWAKPEGTEAISTYGVTICDSDYVVIKSVSGISSLSTSLTVKELYGNTLYKVYITAFSKNKAYVSPVAEFTTKAYEGFPPATAFTVTYDKKGVQLFGFDSETVLYGGHVSKTPAVTPKNEQIFLGWSKDGKNVIDLKSEKIYSDITLYPVLSDSQPASHKAFISGYDDGSFRPEGKITRAEAATLISRISDKYKKSSRYSHAFSDCKAGYWYEKAIAFCSTFGFIKGYDDGTFNPDGNITRAEFATILVRVFGFEDVLGYNVFSDLDRHWAKEPISILYGAGIIKPDSNGKFRPDEKLTRQDAVRMINGCLGILPDKDAIDTSIANNGYIFTDVPHYSEYYYDIMAAILI